MKNIMLIKHIRVSDVISSHIVKLSVFTVVDCNLLIIIGCFDVCFYFSCFLVESDYLFLCVVCFCLSNGPYGYIMTD